MSDTEIKQRFNRALGLHRRGEYQQAEEDYRLILQSDATQYGVHYLLGTLYLQQNRASDALPYLLNAYEHGEKSADLCNNLGVAYLAQKQAGAAAKYFEEALGISAEYHQARYNLATILLQHQQVNEAIEHFEYLLKVEPDHQQLLAILGECWINRQDYREAVKYLKKLKEPSAELLFKLAYCHAKLEENIQAANTYEKYLKIKPENLEAWINLSYVAERAGLLEVAIQAANQALKLNPQSAEAWNNLGVGYRAKHQLDESITAFENGLKTNPVAPLLKFNLATTFMLSGDYPAGWNGYEERTKLVTQPAMKLTSSRWNGTPVSGKRLVITVDQGLGDTLQFARFLPLIEEESQMQVIMACQETLLELLEYSFPRIRCCDEHQALPEHDLHYSLMSVGKLWELTIGDVGFKEPYLQVPLAVQERMHGDFLPYVIDGHKKIGLVWRGNPVQARDIMRSMALSELSELLNLPGISWFSMNIDLVSQRELKELPDHQIQDLSPLIKTMSDTAALLMEMDLLITVDTSIAHLAGGLGVETWTMLCHTPDWRWHLNRTDSPWYPTMKLFRQPAFGDWKSVVNEVRESLIKRS